MKMKLHEFLASNTNELVERCRAKVTQRSPEAPTRGMQHGVAPFLDQLIKTLQLEQTSDPTKSVKVSGPAGGQIAPSEIGGTATEHGRELRRHGYSIEGVVHEYGDLCQAITDLAFERAAEINTDEFRTMNRCLDNAIAVAVTEFTYQRDTDMADLHARDSTQRLGFFAHEMRNFITTATLAVNFIKSGNVASAGATGQILDRALMGMRTLIDRSLAEVRIESGSDIETRVFSLAGLVTELKVTASLEAASRQSVFIVADVDSELALSGDRDLLLAAVGNLLQNAFKFTRPGTEVTLNAYSAGERIHIDVEDSCGGLPPGAAENMFRPYVQCAVDKSGAGLGLSISRRSVEANAGTLRVRDVPGTGCVFTIDLPRHLHVDARASAHADRSTA